MTWALSGGRAPARRDFFSVVVVVIVVPFAAASLVVSVLIVVIRHHVIRRADSAHASTCSVRVRGTDGRGKKSDESETSCQADENLRTARPPAAKRRERRQLPAPVVSACRAASIAGAVVTRATTISTA